MLSLPLECYWMIFEYEADYNTLYRCLQLNREWCRTVVPIIWRRPSFSRTKIIPTLLLGLNEEEKSLITKFDELIPENKKLFFEYSSIIKVLSRDLTKGVKIGLKMKENLIFFLPLYLH
ncbi:14899_t:CDS:1 [Gigaspora margarita]|uniref:14899_t:CDS:1 n=1 Tax=Gigaspora margarita TaxID=4874 RepID=A0ABN7VD75_GIGMA|nr:14899_t:CDS:1 [Gigaspora margarita]